MLRAEPHSRLLDNQDEAAPADGRSVLCCAAVRLGTHVEVRTRFEDRWSRGFEVAEVVHQHDRDQFRIRRRSDGSELPVLFDEGDLREERRRSTWWV